jgi:hypothetical protein
MWLLTTDQRLAEWKRFRHSINEMPLEKAVAATTHLWSYAPFVNHYLDAAEIANWPDPWTLLADNWYCDLAKALGMLYTLALSDHTVKLDLKVFRDHNNNFYNLVWIDDGKYVINYWHDEVVNRTQIEDTLTLVHSYSAEQLNIEKY